MLTASDITGLVALPATPCLPDIEWSDEAANSVDLDEGARVARTLVADAVGSIALCGTTGEGAALLWSEKESFFRAVIDAVAGDVPVWCGTTALGTREAVRQMKAVRLMGGTGALVGLPMWQTPTLTNAVRFFADLSHAVPDLPVMVYANSLFFKFDFGPDFWAAVRNQAPTVVAAKMGFVTEAQLDAAGPAISLVAGEGGTLSGLYRMRPEAVTAAWATSAAMGPEPWVAFLDAHRKGDATAALQIMDDIDSVPLGIPDFAGFPSFNTAWEKVRINAAGYMRCGEPRPPYTDLPADWVESAQANAAAWRALRSKYGQGDR